MKLLRVNSNIVDGIDAEPNGQCSETTAARVWPQEIRLGNWYHALAMATETAERLALATLLGYPRRVLNSSEPVAMMKCTRITLGQLADQ